MSLPIDRELVTQAVIVFSACFGGWMLFVEPRAEAMHEVEAAIAKYENQVQAKKSLSMEGIVEKAPALRARSSEIDARNVLAGDSSLLYGQIMALAKEHDVQVKNMRPGAERKAGRDGSITVTRIDVIIEGEYERMARFLGALNGIEAFLRQTSVQITPTKRQDSEIAIMRLAFEALRFTLPEAIAQLREAGQ